jgi:hypothetical protein
MALLNTDHNYLKATLRSGFFFEKIKFSVIYSMAKKNKKATNLHELKEEIIEDVENEFEEINGQDASEEIEESIEAQEEVKEDIDSMEYADGKERDELDLIEEKEKIYGIDTVSPFKTADIGVFRRKLETMDRNKMTELAERVAARTYSVLEDQKNELISAFHDWNKQNGSYGLQTHQKKEMSQAFAGIVSVNELETRLKSKPLSDVQSVAARLGFNPGFEKDKLITLITQEYNRQK